MVLKETTTVVLLFIYKDDDEKTEEFKILSFISMVKGSPKIGIPYGHGEIINIR